MDLRKYIDSLDCLGVNQNLSELIESEKKVLMAIFEIKEKIDEKLDELEKKGLKTKQNELYENLCSANDLLFTEFYKKYCGNRFPLDVVKEGVVSQVVDEVGDEINVSIFDDFSVVDEYVRLNLGRLIFDRVKKEDISFIFGPTISENVDLSELFENLIEDYFDEKKHIIINDSEEYKKNQKFAKTLGNNKLFLELNEKILDGFKKSYVEFVVSAINSGLKDNPHADFDVLVKIIDVVFLMFFEKNKLLESYSTFSEKVGGNLDDVIVGSVNDVSDNEFIDGPQYADNLEVKSHEYEWLFDNAKSIFESFGNKCNQEFSDIEIASIEGESKKCFNNFIKKFFKGLNVRDEERIVKYTEGVFKKDRKKIFVFWKQHFVSELTKYVINKDALSVPIEDEKQFIDQMFQKYPNAKKYSGNISRSKREQLKSEFINKWNTLIVDIVNGIVNNNSEFFDELCLQDLFIFEQLSKLFFDNEKDSFSLKFNEYIFNFIEDNFVKSHGKIVMREDSKSSTDSQTEKKVKEEKSDAVQKPSEVVVVKKKLPEGLVIELEKYFGGPINPDLERSLRNCGGVYKTSWFDRFGVDDGFFEILNRFGFVCEDIPEEEKDENPVNAVGSDPGTNSDSQNDSINEIDDEFSKLRKLIEKIGSTEDVDKKVDYYIQAFALFYDFKDVETFRTQILNSIKYDNRVLKGVDLVLYKILNGQKEEIKTSGMTKRRRYFRFDLGYNTGYRIVIQDQDGSNRRIIVDFVDHDTYSNNISNYLKAF